MDAPQAKASEKASNSADNTANEAGILAAHTANAEVPLPATNAKAGSPATQHAAVGQPQAHGNVGSDDPSQQQQHQQQGTPGGPPMAGGPGTGNPEEVVLFVSGFGYSLTDEAFAALFSTYGKVVSCKVLIDIPTGKSKGCGLMRMENKKGADAAIAGLHNTTLPGQVTSLTVKYADTPEEKSRRRARQLMQNRFNPLARPGAPMPFPMMGAPGMAFPNVAVPGAGMPGAYPSYPAAPAAAAGGAATGAYPASYQQLQAMQEAAAYSTVPGQFTLYVGGLAQGVDEGAIYKMFSPYGAVAGVKVVMDPTQPTMHKGFCFVNFFRYEEACQAIYALNNQQFGEKRLQVSFKTAPKAKGMQGMMRMPGAATGGYSGPAMGGAPAAAAYPSYPAGGAATYAATTPGAVYPGSGYSGTPAAGAAGTQAYGGSAASSAAYQQYPYGGSYQ